MSSFVLALTTAGAAFLTSVFRLRVIVLIALVCWVQNFVLPWSYTEGWLSARSAGALLLTKEILLALAVLLALWRLLAGPPGRLPGPIRVAAAYAAYCAIRVLLGVTVLGESAGDDLRLLRSLFLPPAVLVVGYAAARERPRLGLDFPRVTIATLSVLAVISLGLFFVTDVEFWRDHVNIAAFNIDVKGDEESGVLLDLGVSGSAAGREAFEWLSALRLIGTFGDPLTAGLVMALGLILLAADWRRRRWPVVTAAILGACLLLTFSRSGWLLALVGVLVVLSAQRRRGAVVLVAVGAATVVLGVASLRAFLAASLSAFRLGTGDVMHAQGVLGLYSREVLVTENVLGRGPGNRTIPENGLAFLLEQFGVVALVLYVALCVSVVLHLRRHWRGPSVLAPAAAGLAVGTIVVSHFAEYGLSFTAYYAAWLSMGLAVGLGDPRSIGPDESGPYSIQPQ